MRALLDATIGRRLVVRIWFHGVLLFAGVIAVVMIARAVMSDVDQGHTLRAHPYLAVAIGDRVLARAGDPAALQREIARVDTDTPVRVAVFEQDQLVAGEPMPPPSPSERAAPAWSGGRIVVGAGGTYAVIVAPPPPSVPWHLVMLLGSALLLGFVFVAGPLAYSIARPIERLGVLARELGSGNLAVRAKLTRRDEIGDLARSFDTMAGQIQQLRSAERALLDDVSHELRTPLSRMRVVLDLASDADPERVRRYLAEIAIDLAELDHLIDDILVSSQLDPDRWEAARPPLHKAAIAVDDLVEASVSRFRMRSPERTVEAPPRAQPAAAGALIVDGDLAMLRRALDNLLDNARKYSAAGAPIEVRVARDRDAVRVEVVDRGVGIAPEDQPRVFSAFFRADRSRTRASGGVGLGLALVRRIVEAHGGTVGFESELDRGSRFWFTLATLTPVSR
ncbi:MAG: HAMP domain-containing sensor histidine kinase [Kofleriaceae bacterium]